MAASRMGYSDRKVVNQAPKEGGIMATSSIFRTPQFNTEKSVRSLVEAMEATMAEKTNYRDRMPEVRRVKDPKDIRRILESAR